MSGVVDGARRLSWALAAAATVGLLAGACDPGETPTDPVTTDPSTVTQPATSSSSASPSVDVPTPPELEQPVPPAEAGVDDRAGAAAVAEYFLRVLQYAQATTDVRVLDEISGPECGFCQGQIESIELRAEAGQWAVGDAWEPTDIRVQYPSETQPAYLVRLVLDVPGATVMSAEGVVDEWPAATYPNYLVAVEWVGDRFVVQGVDSDTTS